MDDKTEVVRHLPDGEVFTAAQAPLTLQFSDIVAGNRYRDDDILPYRLIPDPDGPWLALVTHRGEFAPPRPKTLPVGAKVRRGPDWCWGEQDGGDGAVGTVVALCNQVLWPTGAKWFYATDDLEIVSLPEPAPAPVPPIVERERARLEAAKAAPDDGTAARVIEEGLRAYKTQVVVNVATSWTSTADAVAHLAAAFGNLRDTWRWDGSGSSNVRTGDYVVGTYGISAHEAGQRPATGDLPDMIPAAVLARRASQPRRVYVPTDLDDHWIPDAEPECGIVVRKAVV